MHHKFVTHLKVQLMVLLLSLCSLLPITNHAQTTNTNSITFNYIDDAKLTPNQVETVLTLAKGCGLKSPAVIGTGKTLPFAARFVYVQSAERTNHRKTTFDSVSINYSEWSKGKWKKQAGAKYLGDFWVNPPYLDTNSFALFQINNRPVNLQFDENIPLPLADKMLKCFEDGKIEFATTAPNLIQITKEQLQNLIDLEPASLNVNRELACYEMFTAKKSSWIRFNYGSDKIEIHSISNALN